MAIVVRSADDSVIAVETFAHISVTGVADNEVGGDELRYYIWTEPQDGDHDPLQSHVFSPSADGDHAWDNVLFPVAGTWDIELRDASDDSVVESDTVVVA
jgi:hypothetical protein